MERSCTRNGKRRVTVYARASIIFIVGKILYHEFGLCLRHIAVYFIRRDDSQLRSAHKLNDI